MWESITTDVCHCTTRPSRVESSFVDKENIQPALSPVKNEDFSLYDGSSPAVPLCSGTSPNHCNHNIISRHPLEDHDPNSRDSGYSTNYHGDGTKFLSYASPSRGLSFESSIGSMDEEFFEDFSDFTPLEDKLPNDFNKLINGPLAQNKQADKDLPIRPLFRRALSFQNEITPTNSRVRSCLFKPVTESRPFKRTDSPLGNPTSIKKQKVDDGQLAEVPNVPRPVFQRAFSATEESIMCAVQRSSVEPDLIGDFTKTFCLPLVHGRHQDLKSITAATLAQLIHGGFSNNVASYRVIDCRYPYEYEGGHIDGAFNIYTKDQCMELLNTFAGVQEDNKRTNILVFHCEFSSERGPNLYRYLRQQDRHLNQEMYPSLHFPEVYLLEGGYKKFFEQYSLLCVPVAYKEMLHPEHENDLRYFRLKSKTWNVDTRQRGQSRYTRQKLGL